MPPGRPLTPGGRGGKGWGSGRGRRRPDHAPQSSIRRRVTWSCDVGGRDASPALQGPPGPSRARPERVRTGGELEVSEMKVVIDDLEPRILDARGVDEAVNMVVTLVKEKYGEDAANEVRNELLDAVKALNGFSIAAVSIDLRENYAVPGVAFVYDGKVQLGAFKELIERHDVSIRLPWYEQDLKLGALVELYFDI